MISNGVLKHGVPESLLATLQFTSPVFYFFLVAFLTALFSYQAVGTIFDLLLGCKPRGLAKLTDLFTLHFSERLSLFSVLPELFKSFKLWKIWHHGLKHETHTRERRGSFSTLVTFKLVLLLSCGPIINLLSIILSLEVSKDLTFSSAKFGGIALGKATPSMETKFFPAKDLCHKFLTDFGAGAINVPDFFVCEDLFAPTVGFSNSTITVRIVQGPSSLGLEIKNTTLKFTTTVGAFVRVGNQTLKLRQVLSTEDVQSLWNDLSNRLRESCGSRKSNIIEQHALSEVFDCKSISFFGITRLLIHFRGAFTLVEADRFEVSEDGISFRRGDDLRLFTRRRPYVSLKGLIVGTAAVVLVRIVTSYLTNNDIDVAMDLVMRKSLGVEGFDTMLSRGDMIMYDEAAEIDLCQASSGV